MSDVLILGATGTTGRRVSAFLAARGITTRLASRSPGSDPARVRFDWTEPSTHADAVAGVRAIYLVAPVGVHDPVPLVEPFLQLARRHGVRRVVALGSSAVPEADAGMGGIYRAVRAIMPEWTVLRPSWFMQNFVGEHALARGVHDGEIVSATARGRIGFIDAGDIAAVAGHALIDEIAHNTEHVLTGPRALGYDEAARIISESTGRRVRHRSIPADELARRWEARGLAPEFAAMLAALDEDIGRGGEDRVTDTVVRITGRTPRAFAEFVEREMIPGRSINSRGGRTCRVRRIRRACG
ncbi:NAD(P)H-binding protein [Nocardia pseudobrasiliensis]|uniref:Uncharacterized protein YbjT (DUF2867 family) n=1 Tax=Nocardia pseudobrasiliensis TaxID=45979 RepID=A0A370IEB0_9NOCA|nr:NAD(P)H-binding protein [Nocardia pseudobrasiliensis]RDI67764.1 uncharacterized protein YbjT (DUF2867 family) [Nocardia pseudobrasiliensis]